MIGIENEFNFMITKGDNATRETFNGIRKWIGQLELGQQSMFNIKYIKYLYILSIRLTKIGMPTNLDLIVLNETLNLLQRNVQSNTKSSSNILETYFLLGFFFADSSTDIAYLMSFTKSELEKENITIQKLSETVLETMSTMEEFKKEQNQKMKGNLF